MELETKKLVEPARAKLSSDANNRYGLVLVIKWIRQANKKISREQIIHALKSGFKTGLRRRKED